MSLQTVALKYFNKVVRGNRQFNDMDTNSYLERYNEFFIKDYNTLSEDALFEIYSYLRSTTVNDKELSKTFYKDWDKVLNLSEIGRFIDQITHYMSGGKYFADKELIERVGYQFSLVESMDYIEFRKGFTDLITMNIAFTQEDIQEFADIINKDKTITKHINIDDIRNKELKLQMYGIMNIVPNEPEEFLKYVYFKVNGNTLFVKNDDMYNELSHLNVSEVNSLFTRYYQVNGLEPLASIFNRNKKVFLSIKEATKKGINLSGISFKGQKNSFDSLRKTINRISKLSKTEHKPKITPLYLRVTNEDLSTTEFLKVVSDLDTSYLVKLYNAIRYRINVQSLSTPVFIYRVRNGKGFYKVDKVKNVEKLSMYEEVLRGVISDRINKVLKDKDSKISSDIDLAVPVNSKQFIGNVPFGSSIRISSDKNPTVGIYWENQDSRVDLDLSSQNIKGVVSWCASYNNNTAVYSGDVTNGENGACEMQMFKDTTDISMIAVNLFTGQTEVDYKLFFGSTDNVIENEMLSSSEVQVTIPMKATRDNTGIGFVKNNTFIFDTISTNFGAVAGASEDDLFSSIEILSTSKLKFSDLDLHQGKNIINENSRKELLELII